MRWDRGDQPPVALPVNSPESGSSQSVGTTFVPDTEEAITSTALISMHDRQNRLTSLLHHLTVDPGAPHQELSMAGSLPALRVEEPPQVDDASVGSNGDRAMPELQRQFLRNLNTVTPVEAARGGWLFARLFIIAGVAAVVVGSGIVLLPGARKAGNETVQAENPPPPVAASVPGHDSMPQENTEPPVAANVQCTTGVPPPTVHKNPPQENTQPAVTAKVQSATAVPAVTHDSLPQGDSEPAVTDKVQSAAGVPALTYDGLPQGDTEPAVTAEVQSAAGVPSRVYDNPAQTTNHHRAQRRLRPIRRQCANYHNRSAVPKCPTPTRLPRSSSAAGISSPMAISYLLVCCFDAPPRPAARKPHWRSVRHSTRSSSSASMLSA
jgi:hypothetical protein